MWRVLAGRDQAVGRGGAGQAFAAPPSLFWTSAQVDRVCHRMHPISRSPFSVTREVGKSSCLSVWSGVPLGSLNYPSACVLPLPFSPSTSCILHQHIPTGRGEFPPPRPSFRTIGDTRAPAVVSAVHPLQRAFRGEVSHGRPGEHHPHDAGLGVFRDIGEARRRRRLEAPFCTAPCVLWAPMGPGCSPPLSLTTRAPTHPFFVRFWNIPESCSVATPGPGSVVSQVHTYLLLGAQRHVRIRSRCGLRDVSRLD